MRILLTTILSLSVIIDLFECSTQSKHVPDENTDSIAHGCGTSSPPGGNAPETTLSLATPNSSTGCTSSYKLPLGARSRSPLPATSPGRNYPDTTLSLAIPYYSARSPPSPKPSLRERSRSPFRAMTRSPSLMKTFPRIFGFKFEDLEYIRLYPYSNPSRIFELRKYTFPSDVPIRLRNRYYDLLPIPTEEQIVLSTSNGDVCAILEKTSTKNMVFRGIYKPTSSSLKRAKINMRSSAVGELTSEEIKECAISMKKPVSKNFRVLVFRPELFQFQ